MDFSRLTLAVVGDIMLDRWVHGRVDRLSPEAPVPVFVAEHMRETAGGAGNVATNVRALGARCSRYGKPPEMRPVKTRYMVGNRQMFRVDSETIEPLADERADDIARRVVAEKPDLIILSDYAKGVCTPYLCQRLIGTRIPVIVDPKGNDWTKYKGAAVLTPNEAEAQAHVGDWPRIDILRTRGALGMELWPVGASMISIPAHTHKVADVTGAGDTVIATLGCCLAAGMHLETAARWANAAAGVVVQKPGTATCSLAEVEAALD